ncbi:MAG TPA: hypothetical protein H9903_10410 [Candidatus Aquabacterium excrementipullorum]|nr:hypothetical protein [Candidatus Aquabacterium excrementipullorum]
MLEKLYMPQARTVVRTCLDHRNPTAQGEALAMRGRWLAAIEKGVLEPQPGVKEALERLSVPQ